MNFIQVLILSVLVAMIIVATVMFFTFLALEKIIAMVMVMFGEEDSNDKLDNVG